MNSSTDSTLIPRFSRVLVGTIPAKSKQSSKNKSPPPPKKKKLILVGKDFVSKAAYHVVFLQDHFQQLNNFDDPPLYLKGANEGIFIRGTVQRICEPVKGEG